MEKLRLPKYVEIGYNGIRSAYKRKYESVGFKLFQLARSRFGYMQYLTSDSEDREGLIEFAFWRTAICRDVKENVEEIVKALMERMR